MSGMLMGIVNLYRDFKATLLTESEEDKVARFVVTTGIVSFNLFLLFAVFWFVLLFVSAIGANRAQAIADDAQKSIRQAGANDPARAARERVVRKWTTLAGTFEAGKYVADKSSPLVGLLFGFVGASGVLYSYRLTRKQIDRAEIWKVTEYLMAQVKEFNNDQAVVNVHRILEGIGASYPTVLTVMADPAELKLGEQPSREAKVRTSGFRVGKPELLQLVVADKSILQHAFTPDDGSHVHSYVENLIAWQIDRFCEALQSLSHLETFHKKEGHELDWALLKNIDVYWMYLLTKDYDPESVKDDPDKQCERKLREQLRTYMMYYTPQSLTFLRDHESQIREYFETEVADEDKVGVVLNFG
jgi:hypothetical protein